MPNQPDPQYNASEDYSSRRRLGAGTLHGGDSEEATWAVSYADMLMVLMSFFIVFFNIEDKSNEGDRALQKFALGLKQIGIEEVDPKTGSPLVESKIPEVDDQAPLLQGFSTKDKKTFKQEPELEWELASKVKFSFVNQKNTKTPTEAKEQGTYKDTILIDFKDDLFPIGGYQLNQKSEVELKEVLNLLSPYQKDFHLIFVGHADSIPIKKQKRIISSNLILSSLRAAKAVELALNNGFDPNFVSAQGVAEYSRNSRTISLKIMRR